MGVKLWVAQRCTARSVSAIVHRATELKALVFQHTWLKTRGNLAGEITPQDLAELCEPHPDAKIILGHTGGNWEVGIRAVRHLQHVAVNIGGGTWAVSTGGRCHEVHGIGRFRQANRPGCAAKPSHANRCAIGRPENATSPF